MGRAWHAFIIYSIVLCAPAICIVTMNVVAGPGARLKELRPVARESLLNSLPPPVIAVGGSIEMRFAAGEVRVARPEGPRRLVEASQDTHGRSRTPSPTLLNI